MLSRQHVEKNHIIDCPRCTFQSHSYTILIWQSIKFFAIAKFGWQFRYKSYFSFHRPSRTAEDDSTASAATSAGNKFAEHEEVEVFSRASEQESCGWWRAVIKMFKGIFTKYFIWHYLSNISKISWKFYENSVERLIFYFLNTFSQTQYM